MTIAVRRKTVVQPGGVIEIRSSDLTPGAAAEVIVLLDAPETMPSHRHMMTATDLLESDLVGIWEDREDIGDSVEFARRLRRQAEQRESSRR